MSKDLMFQDEIGTRSATPTARSSGAGEVVATRLYSEEELAELPEGARDWALGVGIPSGTRSCSRARSSSTSGRAAGSTRSWPRSGRSHGEGDRSRHRRGDARSSPRQRRAEAGVDDRTEFLHGRWSRSTAGRLGRRRGLERRPEPVGSEEPGARRDLPRLAARRPDASPTSPSKVSSRRDRERPERLGRVSGRGTGGACLRREARESRVHGGVGRWPPSTEHRRGLPISAVHRRGDRAHARRRCRPSNTIASPRR